MEVMEGRFPNRPARPLSNPPLQGAGGLTLPLQGAGGLTLPLQGAGGLLPPYLPSTAWLQANISDGRFVSRADRLRSDSLKPRDYTRCLIESNSPEGLVLTVPVVGGSSAAKRLRPEMLEVSGHGDWTRIHLGAMEAAYGREPYFQHLFPEIADIITDYPQQLARLNVLLMEKMMSFLDYSQQIDSVKELEDSNPARSLAISRRLEAKIDIRHSFIEPLFRFGPDSIFLL